MKWLIAVALLFLLGCAASEPMGPRCMADRQCTLPFEYAIRSSCPFATACIEGNCAVLCYDYAHAVDPNVNESYPVQCEADAECDCKFYVAEDIKRCACVNGICAAIVNESKL